MSIDESCILVDIIVVVVEVAIVGLEQRKEQISNELGLCRLESLTY